MKASPPADTASGIQAVAELEPQADEAPLRILVTGATGLIGTALTAFLRARGHEVLPLQRVSTGTQNASPTWNPASGEINLGSAGHLDAVIHLAGENIAGRWTRAKKQRLEQSRVQGTSLLCEALVSLPQPPRVLVAASAVGYYGDRGSETVSEASAPGNGFLAGTCHAWENASSVVESAGIRRVLLRLGMVLSSHGGALARKLLPFRLGLGARLGTGNQYWSWIALEDVVLAIHLTLHNSSLAGPLNVTTPEPVTNREFSDLLGEVLRRPVLARIPALGVRWLLGEMGKELLLSSCRAMPTRLLTSGFTWRYSRLEAALRALLQKE